MSLVKYPGSTGDLPGKLPVLSLGEGDGTHGVAVECVDIVWNTCGEGGHLAQN